jgi:hypothetical protein
MLLDPQGSLAMGWDDKHRLYIHGKVDGKNKVFYVSTSPDKIVPADFGEGTGRYIDITKDLDRLWDYVGSPTASLPDRKSRINEPIRLQGVVDRDKDRFGNTACQMCKKYLNKSEKRWALAINLFIVGGGIIMLLGGHAKALNAVAEGMEA